ncbi:MAG: MFS transporter [Deltaproteobacteria bacterium]|nr:MFS transporter [Deltaproteobacteria bacterium]
MDGKPKQDLLFSETSEAGPETTGPKWLRFFPALMERDFRTLWLGMLPGILAMQMYFFTNGYLAFELTGEAKSIGYVSLGFGVPMLIFSLIGGVAADRYSKRTILMITQWTIVFTAVIMAVLVITGVIRIWHMVLMSGVMGSAFTFHMPARVSFAAELISPPRLVNAIALNGAGLNACRVIGPPLAGWLISKPWLDIGGVYVIMAVMSSFVVIGLIRIPDRGVHAQAKDTTGARAVIDGIFYVRGNPILLVLLILSIAPIVLGLPFQALMPVFAKKVFEVGPRGLGLLMMANGIGALIGSLAVASIRQLKRPGIAQLVLGVLFGLTLAIFAFGYSYHLALVMMVIVGVVSSSYLALNATLIMDATEKRYHGRVMSVYMLTFSALPLGNMILSVFADVFGAPMTVGFGGLLLAVVVLLFGLASPSYRRMQYGSDSR